MICGWAHVMHAIYKPWGRSSQTYRVQHMSLFVTTFVFTMGLLFKVGSIRYERPVKQFFMFHCFTLKLLIFSSC